MRRLGLAGMLVLGSLVACGSAAASQIVVRCGPNLCRLDPAKPKLEKLTENGTKKNPYSAASLSLSGRSMAFWFGRDLYVARANAKGRRKLKTRGLRGQAFMRADGRQLGVIESVFLPSPCPIGVFSCGSSYRPYLYLHDFSEEEPKGVASGVVTSGWWGKRLLRDSEPDERQVICALAVNTDNDCGQTVAADDQHDIYSPAGSPDGRYVAATLVTPEDAERLDLDGRIGLFDPKTGELIRLLTRGPNDTSPAFSPDGKQVAFNRGRDLLVIHTNGADLGRARLLARKAIDPSWSR